MIKLILVIILSIEIISTFIILDKVVEKFDFTYSPFCMFRVTRDYLASLFKNRNAFGIFIVILIYLISIPSIIIIIMADIIMLVPSFFKKIWELGSKK